MAVLPTGIGPVTGYNIERSLRFNSADSAYLNRTPASAGNRKTWTWSGWVKRGSLGVTQWLFDADNGSTDSTEFNFAINSGDALSVGGSLTTWRVTTQVFRDVGAWYHVVLAVDTTQATANNRIRLYVNGSEITAFSTLNNPTQNLDLAVNQAIAHYIGIRTGLTSPLSAYLAEVNFVDGQALTPSSFGETDSNTGVWKPKAYTGTYGTNGFYLPFKTASQWSGYFDGTGDYLSFNGSTGTTLSGDFTVESWVYLPSVTTTAPIMCIGDSFSSPGILFYVNSSSKIAIARANTVAFTGSTSLVANTWNHVAFVRSGSTITGYLNGVSQGTFTNSSTFSGTTTVIGREVYNSGVGGQLTGYISNLRIVNGTAVYTGTFTPPTSQLTAITNTSLLTCQSSTFVDNSTNAFTITAFGDARPQQFSPFTLDVTDDHSGTGNNWIPNNLDLRTTGTGADILVDSPTSYGTDTGVGGEVRGNYCTLNPLDKGTTATLANGNLFGSTSTTAWAMIRSTFAISSGKWYWEFTVATTQIIIGLAKSNAALANYVGADANGWGWYGATGNKVNGGTQVTYVGVWAANDVIGVSFDADVGTLVFYKNGTSQGTAYTGLTSGPYFPAISFSAASDSANANFGQRAFANTAPSGFKALCTQNLPTPTIGATSTTQANDYFDVKTRTGANGATPVSGIGFQPDFVWVKGRNVTVDHALFDAVRGVAKTIYSSSSNAEATNDVFGYLSAFNSSGYSFTTGSTNIARVDSSLYTYVDWLWKANGAGSSNTAGTITSTVSANTTSGFSIVTYTGTGANATVGHGLGVAPSMIIVKRRDAGSSGWSVYFTTLAAGYILALQSTNAQANAPTRFTTTLPTSTVFSIGTDSDLNASAGTYVAYCFAPVAGYSAFGSYTGNGAADGPFVYTGFRPRFILAKSSTTAATNWFICDTSRSPENVADEWLLPNGANAEQSNVVFDILSNGFKLRNSAAEFNTNVSTYIYAAFAESPFKYSLAR